MSAGRPLAGRRVVMTRPIERAGALAGMLRDAGAEVIELPLITIAEPADGGVELREALADVSRYDWLVVTSPSGATRVAAAVSSPRPSGPRVAAVGTGTAAALRTAVDLVPQRQVAEGLLEVFPSGPGRVLLAQAEAARPVLAEGLRAKGWEVDAVVAYRTLETPPADPTEALGADAVVFASGSQARAWRNTIGTRTPPVVVTIGPVSAAAAADAGLQVTAVADDHSLDGLVKALAQALSA